MKLFSTLFLILSLLFSIETHATVVVSNGLTHIHEGSQGQTIRGTIEVKNIGEIPEKIIVSKQDLLKFCNPDSPDNPITLNHDRSLNNWIDLSVLEKELSPGEEFNIIYDIAIPEDGSLIGSYWTMVIVEIARPIKRNAMDHGFMIDSKIRYGIQVITNIGTGSSIYSTETKLMESDSTLSTDSLSINSDSTLVLSMDSLKTSQLKMEDSLSTEIDSLNSVDSLNNEIAIEDSLLTEIDSLNSVDSLNNEIAIHDSIALTDTLNLEVENIDSLTLSDSDSLTDEYNSEIGDDEGYYEEEIIEEEESLLEFIELKKDIREGVQFIYTKLENYDIFLMNIAIIIDLYDENGEHIKKIETPLKKLYPNSCAIFEIPLEEIPAGQYDAIIVADYGKDLYGINVSLTIDEK